ncbi:MAG TPA: type IX secretion system outer membrane channel protein PorV [Flavipsychrobacter sp.]|nr:type IX secretion system outer membrane channel protein PorV [Flavipsychrobacter sp.]
MKKLIAFAGVLSAMNLASVNAQVNINGQTNTHTTAVPFLRIAPDARSAGMGDVGIATSADANAQHWNVAKVVFSEKNAGISFTYTPWLKAMTPDMSLMYLSGYSKFGKNNDQAVSASLRYFNLGSLRFSDINGQPAGSGRPNEFSFDLGYSRRFSNHLSAGLSLRYIRSSILAGSDIAGIQNKAGSAVAADLGVFYTKPKVISETKKNTLNLGAVISNLGSKMNYNDLDKSYLPANLGLGAAYIMQIDESHQFTIGLDVNKLLVPTPKDSSNTGTPRYYIPEKSVISGVFSSFGDAPGGFGEELKEFQISLGAEYWYRQQFAVRAGYFHENRMKGDRQYFTFGLGVRYKVIQFNGSYLVPTGSSTARNPLANTFRFTLMVEFDNLKGKPAATTEAK